MRAYEFVMVVRPSLKEADRKKLLTTLKEWLKDVQIKKEEDWGQKPLSYVIKKELAGHYFKFHLESESGMPSGFEARLFRNNDIIRHLLLRTK